VRGTKTAGLKKAHRFPSSKQAMVEAKAVAAPVKSVSGLPWQAENEWRSSGNSAAIARRKIVLKTAPITHPKHESIQRIELIIRHLTQLIAHGCAIRASGSESSA
jgi:hypothetical protein